MKTGTIDFQEFGDIIGDIIDDNRRAARRLVIQTALRDENAICVWIQDAGVGFNEHDADRLFEPFHTTKADGLGMGLAINRSIIEAYGGKIWARENPDQGATFQFTLPVLSKEKLRTIGE